MTRPRPGRNSSGSRPVPAHCERPLVVVPAVECRAGHAHAGEGHLLEGETEVAAGGHVSTVTGLRRPVVGRRSTVDYDTAAMTDPHPEPRHALPDPHLRASCGRPTRAPTARLAGWVHRRRDHGQLIFLDLRDRHGITQVVVDKADAPEAHDDRQPGPPRVRRHRSRARSRRACPGPRTRGCRPARSSSGRPRSTILSEAKTPPFYINEPDAPIDEALRLKYRYLDIRREPMARPAPAAQPAWSRRSARSTTRTASSRSRRRP